MNIAKDALYYLTIVSFWVLVILGLIYIIWSSFINPDYKWENGHLFISINDHLYILVANVFHLVVLISGAMSVALILRAAITNNATKDLQVAQYLIAASLVFIAFLVYQVIDYDPIDTQWKHACSMCPKCT